jgi:hypothetical protein
LYQQPAAPKPEDFKTSSGDHDEFEYLRAVIRHSAAQEERKAQAKRDEANAADELDQFKAQHRQHAALMARSMVNVHKAMSADPKDTDPRLPLSSLGTTLRCTTRRLAWRTPALKLRFSWRTIRIFNRTGTLLPGY